MRSHGVWVAAVARTAVRPIDSELAGWHPVELGAVVGQEVSDRAALAPDDLDEVVVGTSDPVGANGADVARALVLQADWPGAIGGYTVDRGETSGAMALHAAVASIRSGHAERVLVVGLGVCSVVPPGAGALNRTYGAPWGTLADRFADRGGLLPAPRLAERAAADAGFEAEHLDAWAERSRREREQCGASRSIVTIAARPGDASPLVRRGDAVFEDGRRTFAAEADLSPMFADEGLLTSSTFAPPADAVAAVLIQRGDIDSDRTVIAGVGRAAGDPLDPIGGTPTAVRGALEDAHIDLADVDTIDVVESNAIVPLLVARSLDIDPDRLNQRGGAIATGDSGSAEEIRLVTDAVAGTAPSSYWMTVSAGPTGAVATVGRQAIDEPSTRSGP